MEANEEKRANAPVVFDGFREDIFILFSRKSDKSYKYKQDYLLTQKIIDQQPNKKSRNGLQNIISLIDYETNHS